MKLNFAYPATGAQKLIDIEEEPRVRFLYDKRMGQEVSMESLGPEWKGYICRISGGNDKQGFPMKQGVLTAGRVRLLMSKGHSCYRPRRTGERKRKSVHGCIVDGTLSVLALVVVKKGDGEIEGLTDRTVPRRLGPKRASHIRKLFNLTKDDDVRQYVVRRPLKEKEGKKLRTKAPKIQRLVTPRRLQRKRFRISLKKKRAEKSKGEAAEYAKLLAQRAKEEKERKEEAKRRRSSASKSSNTPTQSISEPVEKKKKSGKVPAQAPEVAAALVQKESGKAKEAGSSKSGKEVQPHAAKGKEVPKKAAEVPGKGKQAGPGSQAKPEGVAAGGAQKKAPPKPAVKREAETEKAAAKDAAVAPKPAPAKKKK